MLSQKKTVIFIGLLIINRSYGEENTEYSDEIFTGNPQSIVKTPSNMTQSLRDAPGAITVITSEQISNLGLKNIPDILRLVPGMQVGQWNAWDYRVSYHGNSNFFSRRMQVLIDGVSVYRGGIAKVDWLQLPIAIKNIARIEVTRTPSSAVYGVNAFEGVINIISKKLIAAKKQENVLSSELGVGSHGTEIISLQYTTHDHPLRYQLSVEDTKNDGFDKMRVDTVEPSFKPGEMILSGDSYSTTKFNLKSDIDISPNTNISLEAANVTAKLDMNHEIFFIQVTPPNTETNDNYIRMDLSFSGYQDHTIKFSYNYYQTEFRKEWRNWFPAGITLTDEFRALYFQNQSYVQSLLHYKIPTGGSDEDNAALLKVENKILEMGPVALIPVTGDANVNYDDAKNTVEITDNWLYSDKIQSVTTLGMSYIRDTSETYLNNSYDFRRYWMYSNTEYKPNLYFTTNLGFMYGKDSVTEKEYVAPRIGLSTILVDGHSLKYIYSIGKRSPDLLESKGDWSFHIRNISPSIGGLDQGIFYYERKTEPGLIPDPETIKSNQLIFSGYFSNWPASYELTFFREKMTNLLSEMFQQAPYIRDDGGKLSDKGIDLQFQIKMNETFSLSGTYSYCDQTTNRNIETMMYARHSGSLGLFYKPNTFTYGMQYYGNDYENADTYDRIDFILNKTVALKKLDFYGRARLEHIFSDAVSQTEAITDRQRNFYNSKNAIFVDVGMEY